jgi:hypothetical protein
VETVIRKITAKTVSVAKKTKKQIVPSNIRAAKLSYNCQLKFNKTQKINYIKTQT